MQLNSDHQNIQDDWQMKVAIVPSIADEGTQIDMFTGINSSSHTLIGETPSKQNAAGKQKDRKSTSDLSSASLDSSTGYKQVQHAFEDR